MFATSKKQIFCVSVIKYFSFKWQNSYQFQKFFISKNCPYSKSEVKHVSLKLDVFVIDQSLSSIGPV